MTNAELTAAVAKALPFLAGLEVFAVAICIYLLHRNRKCDARDHRTSQADLLNLPRLTPTESVYDQEENWLRILMAELRARGVHGFTNESDSSKDDELEEDVVEDSSEQRELVSVLDATGRPPRAATNSIVRSIWKDTPSRGWPREGGQFEFKHLPTGSVVTLKRSNADTWVAFAALPRTPGVRKLNLPKSFNQQYVADWNREWTFSKIPKNKPKQAIDAAKRWFLAALGGEVEVTDGALTPTRNKERDYFGPRSRS